MSNNSNGFELNSLIGLRAAKRALTGLMAADSPVHAVLFFGETGAGKSLLAQHLTRFWMCRAATPLGACGECPTCQTVARNASPDLLAIFPRGASHWIHLAAIHAVSPTPPGYEDVNPLFDFARTLPLSSRQKVMVMEEADRLTPEASHGLLKILEEPPNHLKLVLTTSELSRVPATIRSRCLAVPCELPDPEEWVRTFPSLAPWEEALARRSPGRLERFRTNPEVFEEIFAIAQAANQAPPEGAIDLAERFRKAVDRLAKAEEIPVRVAGATALRALAAALADSSAPPAAAQRIVEAHRRILGNVSAPLEFDAMFSAFLAENRGGAGSPAGVSA